MKNENESKKLIVNKNTVRTLKIKTGKHAGSTCGMEGGSKTYTQQAHPTLPQCGTAL